LGFLFFLKTHLFGLSAVTFTAIIEHDVELSFFFSVKPPKNLLGVSSTYNFFFHFYGLSPLAPPTERVSGRPVLVFVRGFAGDEHPTGMFAYSLPFPS
jgi:hypothetical protein